MIPESAKNSHQKYRLMPGSCLRMVQGVTVQPRCSGFVSQSDSKGDREAMRPVIFCLVKGR